MNTFDYHSRRWKLTRERVLRRDGYLCRESARFGKRVPAETVHHIYPVSRYPELAWLDWNLISLSLAAHNAMHNRDDNEITEAGKAWQQKRRREFERAEGPRPGPEL